jgi:hypothetical protein
MDLVLITVRPRPDFKTTQDGFYRSIGLEYPLNVVEADKLGLGKKKLDEWIEYRAIHVVLDTVECDMEDLKLIFCLPVNEVTPAFLHDFGLESDIINPLTEKSPILCQILLHATQTSRARQGDEIKDASAVRSIAS